MGYIRQNLCNILGKSRGIYLSQIMGYIGKKPCYILWHILGKTMEYIGQKV